MYSFIIINSRENRGIPTYILFYIVYFMNFIYNIKDTISQIFLDIAVHRGRTVDLK